MFDVVRHTIRGAGYLEGFGHHPGTFCLFMFTLMGGIAGVKSGGLVGFIGGCVISFVFTVPFYIYIYMVVFRDLKNAIEHKKD